MIILIDELHDGRQMTHDELGVNRCGHCLC